MDKTDEHVVHVAIVWAEVDQDKEEITPPTDGDESTPSTEQPQP